MNIYIKTIFFNPIFADEIVSAILGIYFKRKTCPNEILSVFDDFKRIVLFKKFDKTSRNIFLLYN